MREFIIHHSSFIITKKARAGKHGPYMGKLRSFGIPVLWLIYMDGALETPAEKVNQKQNDAKNQYLPKH